MNVKSLLFNKTMNLILAIALFVAGVMFCVSPALGEQWVSLVIGIGVLVVGVMTAVTSFLKEKSLLDRAVIVGSIVTAIGVYLMVDRSIVSKVIGIIPYILIITGACVLADSFLVKFVREKNNDKKFGIELAVGAVAVILGGLILGVSAFRSMMAVVIGIALAGVSAYYLYITFWKGKKPAIGKGKKKEAETKTEDKPEEKADEKPETKAEEKTEKKAKAPKASAEAKEATEATVLEEAKPAKPAAKKTTKKA